MTQIKWIRRKEYGCVFDWGLQNEPTTKDYEKCIKSLLNKQPKNSGTDTRDSWECLGLHSERGKLMASYFVGQVWLEEKKTVLQINPKRQDEVDYFKMASECLRHPIVGRHLLDECFHFETEKPPIPVDQTLKNSVILLLVAQYLKELFLLCKRHLRRGFPRIESNLTGRSKGRILIKENVSHNSACGRLDRLYCQYQIHTMDTLENQILKAALEQCLRVLRRYVGKDSLKTLWGWSNEPVSTLSGVKIRRIYPSEFHQIRYSGNLKVYKRPHALAKMILRTLGTDPNRPKEFDKVELPPYSIDMNELFERYCDVLLRKNYKENEELWVGYNNFKRNEEWPLRPDYLIKKNKKAIIDAKYKYVWGESYTESWRSRVREDVYQVLAYSRHKEVLKWLWNLDNDNESIDDLNEKRPDAIYILYPEDKQRTDEFNLDLEQNSYDSIAGFVIRIYKCPVPLPLKQS
jgi:5-methylcytosine-specific restriction enzyme subunit McrC